MERLTYVKCQNRWDSGKYPTKYTSRHTFQEVVARLAAYEDTGLGPEEVLTGKELAEIACAINLLKKYQSLGTIEHFRDLSQAEKDGRLVVLPCKVGDTAYRTVMRKDGNGHVASAIVSGLHMGDTERNRRYKKGTEYIVLKVDGNFCAHIDVKQIGKTVFLTRAEAEAALKKREEADNEKGDSNRL